MKQGKGILYLAVDADTGEAGGMFFAVIPGMDPENLGYDIGMEETELDQVALMDTAAVLPGFRGYNLQYRMMQAAETGSSENGIPVSDVHGPSRKPVQQRNVKRSGIPESDDKGEIRRISKGYLAERTEVEHYRVTVHTILTAVTFG